MENSERKIFRSNSDYIIAGVCGGLAKYFHTDPTIIRIIFVALALGGGSGLFIYLLLWLIIPREPGEENIIEREKNIKKITDDIGEKAESMANEIKERTKNNGRSGRRFWGTVILLIGLVALWNQFMPVDIRWDLFWPIILIFLGLYILFRR